MVRISDILKRIGGIPERKPEKGKEEKPSISAEERPAEKIEKKEIREGIGDVSSAEKETQSAQAMQQRQLDPQESLRLYNRTLDIARDIFKKIESNIPIDLRETYEIIKNIVDRIVLGDKELDALVINSTEDNYLYAHSSNVCILSVNMGLALGYNRAKLNELALGAFLHDLGTIKVIDIAKQQSTLNEAEYEEIKKHPLYSTDILTKVKDIQERVISITQAKQSLVRKDRSGDPKSLGDDQIDEYAQIVAIIDVYEALTHPRPDHKAKEPHEAMKELLQGENAKSFNASILRLLINKIGLYPVGTWVELNTGEFGNVISSNNKSPLRPNINVIFSSDKKKLAQIKSINLSQTMNIYIKRTINPQQLKLKLD